MNKLNAIFLFSLFSLLCGHLYSHTKENRFIACESTYSKSTQYTDESQLKGRCVDVIHTLLKSNTNDSVAIDIFKEDCKITNMPLAQKQALLKKNYKDIIAFFERKENAKYQCEPKKPFKCPDPVLLIEP